MIGVREASANDGPAIWRILEPILRAGETFALPRDISEEDAIAYWRGPGHAVFVAEKEDAVLGT